MLFSIPRSFGHVSLQRFFGLFFILCTAVGSGCVHGEKYYLADTSTPYGNSYAVVVSKETYALEDWHEVADALVDKHPGATLVIYENSVANARESLAKQMPFCTGFVARPAECGRDYIAEVHRLTRKLDDDPWLDTLWGVITGKDAAQALRVVKATAPLEIHRALATTGIDGRLLDDYYLISDGTPGTWRWTESETILDENGKKLTKIKPPKTGRFKTPAEDVAAWAEHFAASPDLIVTSAHGYENGVEMPFSRGIIRVVKGALYPFADVRQTRPAEGAESLLPSPNPKVYFPVGNCLVGHVNNPDCMVTAMMGAHGVNQLAGYTVNTWFGRGGWDMLKLWQSHPGRNTFSESFFFNQQWMLHDIKELDPKGLEYKIKLGTGEVKVAHHVADMLAFGLKFDPRNRGKGQKSPDRQLIGLLWDIDTVAFYGDPAWRARFARPKGMNSPFSAGMNSENNHHKFYIKIHNAMEAKENKTPVGIIFGTRLKNVKLLTGQEYEPIVADNFILVLKPWPRKDETEINIEFEGDPITDNAK